MVTRLCHSADGWRVRLEQLRAIVCRRDGGKAYHRGLTQAVFLFQLASPCLRLPHRRCPLPDFVRRPVRGGSPLCETLHDQRGLRDAAQRPSAHAWFLWPSGAASYPPAPSNRSRSRVALSHPRHCARRREPCFALVGRGADAPARVPAKATAACRHALERDVPCFTRGPAAWRSAHPFPSPPSLFLPQRPAALKLGRARSPCPRLPVRTTAAFSPMPYCLHSRLPLLSPHLLSPQLPRARTCPHVRTATAQHSAATHCIVLRSAESVVGAKARQPQYATCIAFTLNCRTLPSPSTLHVYTVGIIFATRVRMACLTETNPPFPSPFPPVPQGFVIPDALALSRYLVQLYGVLADPPFAAPSPAYTLAAKALAPSGPLILLAHLRLVAALRVLLLHATAGARRAAAITAARARAAATTTAPPLFPPLAGASPPTPPPSPQAPLALPDDGMPDEVVSLAPSLATLRRASPPSAVIPAAPPPLPPVALRSDSAASESILALLAATAHGLRRSLFSAPTLGPGPPGAHLWTPFAELVLLVQRLQPGAATLLLFPGWVRDCDRIEESVDALMAQLPAGDGTMAGGGAAALATARQPAMRLKELLVSIRLNSKQIPVPVPLGRLVQEQAGSMRWFIALPAPEGFG